MSLTKIGSIGINTGIQLAGVTTVSTLHVGSGVTLSSDGDGFFTGITSFTRNVTGDYAVKISNTHATGQGLNIRGGSANGQYALLVEDYAAANLFEINGDGEVEVKANHLRANHGVVVTGIVTASSFVGSGANLTGIDTDLVSDTSPQLGGDLDTNDFEILLDDNHAVKFGANSDFRIYHDGGTSNYIDSYNKDLYIRCNLDSGITGGDIVLQPKSGENSAVFKDNGAVDLYYDNSKKFETISAGVRVTGNMSIADGSTSSGKVALGTGDDLNLYHNGTDSYVENKTGDLYLSTTNSGDDIILYSLDDIQLQVQSGEDAIKCIGNGAVELYYDDDKKFETRSNGIMAMGSSGDVAVNIKAPDNISQSRVIFSDATNTDGIITYDHNTRKMHLGAGTASATDGDITIISSGKVGIGMASPDDTLDVNGTFQVSSNAYFSGTIYALGNDIRIGGTGTGNSLDDYEEGSFTPTLTCQDSALTASYNSQDGVYTKIGNFVYFQIYIRLSSKSGGSGHLRINGLPFTSSAASGAAYGGAVMAYTYNQSGSSAFDRMMIGSGSSQVQLFNGLNNGTNSNAGAGNLNNDTQLRLFGSYRV